MENYIELRKIALKEHYISMLTNIFSIYNWFPYFKEQRRVHIVSVRRM